MHFLRSGDLLIMDTCIRITGLACPRGDCPGAEESWVCDRVALMARRSAMTAGERRAEDAAARMAATPTPGQAAVLARVSACPDRGGVLPISMQDPGCGCGELSECFRGKGKTPGKVGLRDCLACMA